MLINGWYCVCRRVNYSGIHQRLQGAVKTLVTDGIWLLNLHLILVGKVPAGVVGCGGSSGSLFSLSLHFIAIHCFLRVHQRAQLV